MTKIAEIKEKKAQSMRQSRSVSLPLKMWANLHAVAEDSGLNVSDLIEEAAERILEELATARGNAQEPCQTAGV